MTLTRTLPDVGPGHLDRPVYVGAVDIALAGGDAARIGSEAGFSFTSGPLTSDRVFAQLGTERNGRYLR